MTNSDKKTNFKIKLNKEYFIFGVSLFIIFFVILKFSFYYYYFIKAENQFLNKTECNTYKTIYISELKNGNESNISSILKEAKDDKCINILDTKQENIKNNDKKNKPEKENEKVYNSVDIHDV